MKRRQSEGISYMFAVASGAANIYYLGPVVAKDDSGCITLALGTFATCALAKMVASRVLQRFNCD